MAVGTGLEGSAPLDLLEIAEGLFVLDPVRTFPDRGAAVVAKLCGATGYRLEFPKTGAPKHTPPPTDDGATLLLRQGRKVIGVLHLFFQTGVTQENLRLARWGARSFAKGLDYSVRLSAEGSRLPNEGIANTLARSPLTPRERDVVALLVGGASTKDIASNTGLTIATVNTYLKRIFSKLGVHSRVELVAKMAGTSSTPPNLGSNSDSTVSA